MALVVAHSVANEVDVKNDSFFNGAQAVIVGDFIPGEQAAVRLTSPCDGTIVAVQIGWLEGTPGHDPSIERAIHVFDGSTFPTPGTELLLLEAPLLTPGALNEFRYVDENQSIPISIPVAQGQQFYVSLEFENPTDVANGGPSVFRDVDGCQSGKNALRAIPGGWLNFCTFISGDLVIRAVVDCGELSGACCLPSGDCEQLTATECQNAGGTYQGDLVDCNTVNCPEPVGACCFESTGGCLNLPLSTCQGAGGEFQGPGTDCATVECFPTGACCLPDGSCVDGVSPDECAGMNGTFQGNDTACGNVDCPDPVGACCVGDFCFSATESDCAIAGGTWSGPGTDCEDLNSNGIPDACEPQGLKGDMNCDGSIDGADIDPFFLALGRPDDWHQMYPSCQILNGDMNLDDALDGADIDPFFQCLGGHGCP